MKVRFDPRVLEGRESLSTRIFLRPWAGALAFSRRTRFPSRPRYGDLEKHALPCARTLKVNHLFLGNCSLDQAPVRAEHLR
jgi:hypothetical protein